MLAEAYSSESCVLTPLIHSSCISSYVGLHDSAQIISLQPVRDKLIDNMWETTEETAPLVKSLNNQQTCPEDSDWGYKQDVY